MKLKSPVREASIIQRLILIEEHAHIMAIRTISGNKPINAEEHNRGHLSIMGREKGS